MNNSTTYFTSSHEWVRTAGEYCVVGLTRYAVENLGEIVFIEMPAPAIQLKVGDPLCVVESVKAASEIYSPIAGTIHSINQHLQNTPELINSAPEDDGWILKVVIDDLQSLTHLLSREQYEKIIAAE